jgi:hypothetical protein
MKKKHVTVAGLLFICILLSVVVILIRSQNDSCSSNDRQRNNCVPAGRCTPLGDSREATSDCAIKNYDHKFNH